MNTLLRSQEFDAWLVKQRDNKGKARIIARLKSAELGNFGDCKPVGEGVSEMRIDSGPGYRVYFTRRGQFLYLLLVGGDKSTQRRDIKRALQIARDLEKWSMSKRKMKVGFSAFDAADYLDNEEIIAEYLAAALEDSNPEVFMRAIADVAKARGLSEIAKAAGLGRESLYKALAPGAKVRYETVRKLLSSLGVALTVTPVRNRKTARRSIAKAA